MGKLDDNGMRELAEKIKEREARIEQIVAFVKKTTVEIGKLIEKRVGSCNTYVVWELKDFENFDFIFSSGESMMGGETIDIKYSGKVVFKVHRGLVEWEVELWGGDNGEKWQSALDYVIEHEDEFLAQRKKAKEKERKRLESKITVQQKNDKLLAEAKRLKLL